MPKQRSLRLLFVVAVALASGLIVRNLYRRYLDTALIDAVKAGDLPAVRRLLQSGANPNCRDTGGSMDEPPAPPKPVVVLALDAAERERGANENRSAPVAAAGPPHAFKSDTNGEEVALLLLHSGAHPPADRWLERACRVGSVALTAALLDLGVSPNAPGNAGALDAALAYAGSVHSEWTGYGYVSHPRTPAESVEAARRQQTSRQLVQLLRAHGVKLTLMQAVAVGDKETVRQMLDGTLPGLAQEGYSLLTRAATEGDLQTMEQLLQRGVDPNRPPEIDPSEREIPGFSSDTPLHAAVKQRHIEAVRLLLAHGAKPAATDRYTPTPLAEAAEAGDFDMVKLLLAHGAQVNTRSYGAPLNMAIYSKHLEMARYLLAHGASVATGQFGVPLLVDALQRLPALVPDLLRRGAPVNAPSIKSTQQNFSGATGGSHLVAAPAPRSPLMAAVFYAPQYELTLVRAGANIGPDRATICEWAAWMKRLDLLPRLLAYGADINGVDGDHQTALLLCLHGDLGTVRTLLEHGANPDLGLYEGRTALQEASLLGNTPLVRLLLAHGASVNESARHGHPALYWARKRHHEDVARLLQQAGGRE